MDTASRILQLKKEKEVKIFAHYYVDGSVQDVADFVGDSFALAKMAADEKSKNILFCGVKFMGESAKILNPKSRVIMPDINADCPMAHMASVEKIEEVRKEYPGVAVVCYVNSTAQIKAHSDVCVTSSNALKVVKNLDAEEIFLVPDMHLARYIAGKLPEKHFIYNEGYCNVHHSIWLEDVKKAKEDHPGVPVLSHPECPIDVLEASDFVGSTSEIIEYVEKSEKDEFLVATETGVFHEIEKRRPGVKLIPVKENQVCPGMKLVTLDKVLEALENMEPVVELDEDMAEKAKKPLDRMLSMSK